jgi:1-acyl-sn-glycerol-3-phosphate acyltransferase
MDNNLNDLCIKIQAIMKEKLEESPLDVFGLFLTLAGFIAADSCHRPQDTTNAESAAANIFAEALHFRFNSKAQTLH